MYVPPVFRTDEDCAWTFVRERAFGAVVAIQGGTPVASHVPFLATEAVDGRRLAFHVARANPLHEVLAASPRALVMVSGPDGYISPDWYDSPGQVPTWNYVSVHMTGTARVLPPDSALGHVEALSARFEARLAPKRSWTTAKMSKAQRDRMLAAIVPVEISVESVEGQWKLGQHKTAADQERVLRMLDWRGDWSSLALAEMMRARAARPAHPRRADPMPEAASERQTQ
ncbi:MAG: FMN-binding negative transcriptional regulator [Hyphomicrobiaceae bacterium]|nr:FMN-binding negative transcriptional regulator [Hyphomicrobiaceae bacterium]